MRLKLTGLWQHADFLHLWSGQTISVFGSMIGGTGLGGLLGETLGVRGTLGMGACGTLLAALVLAASPLRSLKHPAEKVKLDALQFPGE
jgi:predicted MFS family arabinose efflux permease